MLRALNLSIPCFFSSFTHLDVVANLYEFLSSAEHKRRHFEERLEPNSSLAPLTSIVEKNKILWKKKIKYYGSQWCPTTVWFQSFFKISSFVFCRRKKLIQVCKKKSPLIM